ncbi:uncharacterized protein LOC111269694 isoform X2 [Varroa jacobsoni]|uniref:Uncharacterized protein n=1 Tax=Varroa destructor TaxID=109461 RepID=A0A7M7JFG2_VARDE|nr:uncharacterized protein LOC111246285 isoform X2 [Varroa destructor]XP_022705227.1 uncharacterized protein LOC111269694 isoform X2 [Varroa jacobsoni]
MRFLCALGILSPLVSLCLGAAFSSSSGQCSEECIQYILSDASGPKILRLYKELLKQDTGSLSSVDVNGQTYEVSPTKKNLIQNAIRKGVRESVIEGILDDAAIVPVGPSSSLTPISSRTTQQTIERPFRPEPVRERRPGLETSQGQYRIYTRRNGDINIELNGQTLKVPDDLTRLPHIVDQDTLIDIVRQLRELGVPINHEGNKVTVGSPTSPQDLRLRVSIKKIDDKPSSVTITANNDKYVLPGDEYSLNRYLGREPEVAYHILRILSAHGVPVEYDAQTKTLKTTLTSEDDYITSRTSSPNRGGSITSPSGGLVRPTASSPKVVRIGSLSYYLPEDWDRLREDLQDGRISATSVMDILDMEHIAAPGDIVSIIRTRISTSVGKVRVMRYGDNVTVELGSQTFKLPKDDRELEKALRENEFPIELIRDSLLRIGIDTRRVGSTGLRVLLPGGEAYLSGLPVTKQYQYKIEPGVGTVKIIVDSDTYNLPSDTRTLERAIAEKKILPRTLVDAFNAIGISSEMDINQQQMTVNLSSGTIKIPVPLNVHQQKVGSRLRLNVRGPEGNKVYTLTIGDSRDDKVELPIDVHVLNSYIRTGKVDSNLLMQLLGRMGVAHYLDSANNVHVVTLNGKPYEIQSSPV